MQMSPGHLGLAQEKSSSSPGNGCHGDGHVASHSVCLKQERKSWECRWTRWELLVSVPPTVSDLISESCSLTPPAVRS